jgi:predicted dehydrogenase
MASKKFLIAGLGSIGRRHLKNLESLGERDISLYRTNKSTIPGDEIKDYPVYTELKAALDSHPDAVIISNPTFLHMQVATPAAEAGCALLIEKPLAHQLDDLMAFEGVFNRKKNLVLTAYQFRFNPGLIQMKELLDNNSVGRPISFQGTWGEYLPGWHPWEDYRSSYAANSEMGGGVVLTLSHPLDYLIWLFGSVKDLFANTGKKSSLELQCEDHADVILNFQTGIAGVLHLDYYRQPKRHDLSVRCSDGVISWDYTTSNVVVEINDGEKITHAAPEGFERNDMFMAEMRHFINCMDGKATSVCDYEDGKKVLRLATGILQSGRYRERVIFDSF